MVDQLIGREVISSIIACPRCYGVLERIGSELICGTCETPYQFVTASIPLLSVSHGVAEAEMAFLWFNHQVNVCNQRLAELDLEEWQPGLWEGARCSLVRALRYNREFYKGLIPYEYQPKAVIGKERIVNSYIDFNSYLQRDWSNDARSGRETASIARIIRRMLLENKAAHDSALVLGAGLARLAFDLHPFVNQCYALDSSVTAALMLDKLCSGFFLFHENFSNMVFAGSQVRQLEHGLTSNALSLLESKSVQYIVGDATQAPFGKNAFDLVLSVYFTDVIGLDCIISEIKRVLKVGGHFIHFGPLRYHFSDRRRMYPVELLRKMLTFEGFEIIEDKFVRFTTGWTQSEMMATTYNNWVLLAKRL